ncbi:hypothetical protein ZIOFF_070767 [Zingiber officinale]|uniref:PA domain-containing protein n=1 Tax=Zingiber officinale TaxID=94328 RepID=A0A8J5CAU2_ZINOF|nr:hypothetical protein ZIOFF_070767 [Zingiber officinale]
MDPGRVWLSEVLVLLLLAPASFVHGGDIVHEDDEAPKLPGCSNNFVLVKVQTWINSREDAEFVGVGARFGPTIVSKEKYANRTRITLSDPSDCCTAPKKMLAGEVLLVHRGNCKFTTKAMVAEAAGASSILIINDRKELYKMVCDKSETYLNIGIPAVMLPQDAGASLETSLQHASAASTTTCNAELCYRLLNLVKYDLQTYLESKLIPSQTLGNHSTPNYQKKYLLNLSTSLSTLAEIQYTMSGYEAVESTVCEEAAKITLRFFTLSKSGQENSRAIHELQYLESSSRASTTNATDKTLCLASECTCSGRSSLRSWPVCHQISIDMHFSSFYCTPNIAVQLYSPDRPLVDTAEVFLWFMAIGTILCASYWSAWSAREALMEYEKLLKDAPEELMNMEATGSNGIVDITTTSACLFVVIASCFLILLYKLMSFWFVELLVVLFCIGGVEVQFFTFIPTSF